METNPNIVPTSSIDIYALMPEGYAIERNLDPLALMAVEVAAPSAEAVLNQTVKDNDGESEGFVPYSLDRNPNADEASDTLATGIELAAEEGVVKPILADTESRPEAKSKAKEFVEAAKRSRVGRAVAGVAIAAAAGLSFGTPAAKAETLQQECTRVALAEPDTTQAIMVYPGNKYQQEIKLNQSYESMPVDCNGIYERRSFIKLQLQNYKKHKQWFNLTFPLWMNTFVNNAGGDFTPSIQPTGHEGSRVYYHLTPGRGRTHVREVIKNILENENGDIIGQKIYRVPIKVSAPLRKQ